MDSQPAPHPYDSTRPPRCCRVEDACVITLQDMETPEDFLDTCHHVNLIAKQGHPRMVVDLSDLKKVYSPFLVYLAGFLRKKADEGARVIVAGSKKAITAFLREADTPDDVSKRDR